MAKQVKLNCWQFKNCRRQWGALKSQERGVCPAAKDTSHTGKNGGVCGGRYCWKIDVTFCDDEIQGNAGSKIARCSQCDFYKKVKEEEGKDFIL
ncbi:MAG: hypothetical protein KKH94_05425 [Candidatus Omnitrophica bacterium]|nr:hypothetical protein [Candidatus Omnitrophota bacterium]